MFKPRFWLPPQSGTDIWPQAIVQPPVVRRVIDASKQWFAQNPDPPEVVANAIVQQYAGNIDQFVAAQRQGRDQGVAQIRRTRLELPGLSLDYASLQGMECLTITVRPESVGGSTTQPIETASTFDIDVPFIDWPLVGWQAAQSGSYPGYISGGRNPYFPDPCFVPSGGTPANGFDPNTALLAPGVMYPSVSGNPMYLGGVDWYNNNIANTLGGFITAWWNQNLGQTGFCVTKLTAQKYWEVEIIKLVTNSPPSIEVTFPSGSAGNTETSPVYTTTNGSITWTFPAELNTFFTPTIGVISADEVLPEWTKNIVTYGGIINLDAYPTGRSVGVTRTRVLQGPAIQHSWTPAQYFARSLDTGHVQLLGVGDPCNPSIPNYYWNGGNLICNASGIFGCITGGIAPSAGPTGPTDGSTFSFGTATFTGSPWSYFLLFGDPSTFDHLVAGYNTPTTLGNDLWGDVFWADDAVDGSGNLIATSLNTPGEHTPVIMGRLDAVNNLTTPAQTVPWDSFGAHGQEADGCWTGVDLDGMVVGDTIMVAVDMDKHMIWFGKNGRWYDRGGVSKYTPGDPRLAAAALLDVGNAGAAAVYYPAVSIRCGPTHVKFLFGASQKYPPPGGFVPYSS